MSDLFAVMLARGPAYRHGQPLESQVEWDAHAKFMDALAEGGLVKLGGPLEGTNEVLLIFRAGRICFEGARLQACRRIRPPERLQPPRENRRDLKAS